VSVYEITPSETDIRPNGANAFSFGTAKVVTKSDYTGAEQAAYIIGTLLGLPMAPGFSDDHGHWHSIFVPGLTDFRNYFGQRDSEDDPWRSYTLDIDRINAWLGEDGQRVTMLHRLRVFDEIVGNCDRHAGNVGIDSNGAMVVYDHDLCWEGFSSSGIHNDLHPVVDRSKLLSEARRAAEILTSSVVLAACAGNQRMADDVLANLYRIIGRG
jgi:hypothetical protein